MKKIAEKKEKEMKHIQQLLKENGWKVVLRRGQLIIQNEKKKEIHESIFQLLQEKIEEHVLFFYRKDGNLVLVKQPELF